VRGLVHRGASAKDPEVAERYVAHLVSKGLAQKVSGRQQLVRPTDEGRSILRAFSEKGIVDGRLLEFFTE
jgi:predicted transcriptional regulator